MTPTVSGAARRAPRIFKVFNTNYITIDGSNSVGGTTRDLTLENTSVTSPNVVWFGSSGTTPITGGSLKNCVVRNGVNTSSAVVISDGTTVGSAGYFSNVEIRNNAIEKAFIGVYANGGTTPANGVEPHLRGQPARRQRHQRDPARRAVHAGRQRRDGERQHDRQLRGGDRRERHRHLAGERDDQRDRLGQQRVEPRLHRHVRLRADRHRRHLRCHGCKRRCHP